MARTYKCPSVERAFRVLALLADAPSGLTLTELSRATAVPASTLLSILASMREARVVKLVPHKRYVLDVGILQLGQGYVEAADLTAGFHPVGRRLLAALDETVQLGVLSGREAVYIARQESTQPIRLVGRVGRRLPAHASAVGKALLAPLAPAELRLVLGEEPLAALTPATLTGYEELERELAAVRRQGFAESVEECIVGLHCIAMAVPVAGARAEAAISVSTPRFRMTAARRERVIAQLRLATRELAQGAASGEGERVAAARRAERQLLEPVGV
jgi:DNA-binding IclR family transcriptional regulator